jgi:hypothetical protein
MAEAIDVWFGGLQRLEEIRGDFPEAVARNNATARSVPSLCMNLFYAFLF